MDNIEWFKTGREPGVSNWNIYPMIITFTDKPKGIRFNSTITKKLVNENVGYVKIGVGDKNMFVVKPVETSEEGFKFISSKNTGLVCSAVVSDWAAENGLLKKRVIARYNQEMNHYEFDLSTATGGEDTEEEKQLSPDSLV